MSLRCAAVDETQVGECDALGVFSFSFRGHRGSFRYNKYEMESFGNTNVCACALRMGARDVIHACGYG